LLWAEGKVFSAGLDLKEEASALNSTEGSRYKASMKFLNLVKRWQGNFLALRNGKPIISAIHGWILKYVNNIARNRNTSGQGLFGRRY
jgi:enoyl-CoA hydratase/carnithine racemase